MEEEENQQKRYFFCIKKIKIKLKEMSCINIEYNIFLCSNKNY